MASKKPTTQPDLWNYQIRRIENQIENLKYDAAVYRFNINLMPYNVQVGDIVEVKYKQQIVRCQIGIVWQHTPWIRLIEVDQNGKRINKPQRVLADFTLLYDALDIIRRGSADGSRYEGRNNF